MTHQPQTDGNPFLSDDVKLRLRAQEQMRVIRRQVDEFNQWNQSNTPEEF